MVKKISNLTVIPALPPPAIFLAKIILKLIASHTLPDVRERVRVRVRGMVCLSFLLI